MNLSKFDLPEKRSLMHAAIGGGACLLMMVLLTSFFPALGILEQILVSFGIIGVITFTETFAFAATSFMFGVAYLTSGFVGGMYAGYNIEENLKITLAIPGIIGFAAYIILLFILGSLAPSNLNLVSHVFLPLLGNVIGSYLGGYAMNWTREEEEEDFEEFEI